MEVNYFTILYWFCYTLTWIHHGCTRVPHPERLSHLPPHNIPLGHPSAPAPRILYRTWTGDSFLIWYYTCFNAILPNRPTLSLSHRVQKFTSCGQSIGVSASASVLPMNTQDWSPLGWTSWISLQSRGFSRVFSSTTVWRHQFFSAQPSLLSNSHICVWLLEKP